MCKYRYYYFATCRHQQTVLFDFCEHAVSIATAREGTSVAAQALLAIVNGNDCDGSRNMEVGQQDARVEGAVAIANASDLPCLCPTFTSSSHSTESSLDIGSGSVSITAEPSYYTSSLPEDQSSHASSVSASHDMTTLPLFGGTFQHWMSGAIAPKQSDMEHAFMSQYVAAQMNEDLDLNLPLPQVRVRQAGIRECTDESCDLPKSNDIMQHIAESCRNRQVQHVGTDGWRMTSYGSVAANGATGEEMRGTSGDYDRLGADIDHLKEEFLQLQAGADNAASKTEQDHSVDHFMLTRIVRPMPATSQPTEESAAARLQRQHEQRKIEQRASTSNHSHIPVPPSAFDFPALSNAKTQSQTSSPTVVEILHGHRRPSYAVAATNGMMDAIDHASQPRRRADQRTSDFISDAHISNASAQSVASTLNTSPTRLSSTPETHDVHDMHDCKDDDRTVIIMSEAVTSDRTIEEPIVVWKAAPSTAGTIALKHSPHFAQPTKSFARRTGETVRKDSSPASPKSNGEVSPSKTVKLKEPTFATDKRASHHQQKRKSLPGDWFNGSGQQTQIGAAEIHVKAGNVAASIVGSISPQADMTSPSSADEWQVVEGSCERKSATAIRAKLAESQPEIQRTRKKISSYMAPTSAATQRTIATLGQEKTKGDATRASNRDLRVETRQVKTATSSPTQLDTASSDSSSVQFILERPSLNAQISPSRVPSKFQVQSPTDQKRSPIQTKSPVSVSSPNIGVSRDRNGGSPTKIPRASKYGEHPGQAPSTPLADRSENWTPFRQVANTTAKRRTSNGHLLKPIFACLDAKGLLNKTSAKNAVIESYFQCTGDPATPEKPSARPERRSGMGSESSGQSEVKAPVRRVVPPHLRKTRGASTTSTSTDGTLGPNTTKAATAVDQNSAFADMGRLLPHSYNATGDLLIGMSNSDSAAKSASLRATAQEFKPMWQPGAPVEEIGILETPSLLGYWADDIWSTMHPTAKQYIQSQREIERAGLPQSGTFPRLRSPSHARSRGFCDNLTTPRSADNAMTGPARANGFTNEVVAGQVLKPTFSPGKNNLQWMLQDVDGSETPIKFGRAPPPTVSPIYKTSTPTISTSSNDTSPMKSPYDSQAWRINSASSPNFYGWKGGDGKEISFVGYGPHAERDPHSVVNFNFQGQTSSLSNPISRYAENIDHISSAEHLAPRSRRQWAEKLGLPKVPCGNIEITSAVEHIPFGSQLAGYCYDCMAK